MGVAKAKRFLVPKADHWGGRNLKGRLQHKRAPTGKERPPSKALKLSKETEEALSKAVLAGRTRQLLLRDAAETISLILEGAREIKSSPSIVPALITVDWRSRGRITSVSDSIKIKVFLVWVRIQPAIV